MTGFLIALGLFIVCLSIKPIKRGMDNALKIHCGQLPCPECGKWEHRSYMKVHNGKLVCHTCKFDAVQKEINDEKVISGSSIQS
jgi:hypothetical protein